MFLDTRKFFLLLLFLIFTSHPVNHFDTFITLYSEKPDPVFWSLKSLSFPEAQDVCFYWQILTTYAVLSLWKVFPDLNQTLRKTNSYYDFNFVMDIVKTSVFSTEGHELHRYSRFHCVACLAYWRTYWISLLGIHIHRRNTGVARQPLFLQLQNWSSK